MIWTLMFGVLLIAIVGLGMRRARGGRARNRLNDQGWPGPYSGGRQGQNGEE